MQMKIGLRYLFLYVASMLVFILVAKNQVLGERITAGVWGAFGVSSRMLAEAMSSSIASYRPKSVGDAKICNEKIKLIATLFNAVAIVLIVAGLAKPLTELELTMLEPGNLFLILAAIFFHAGAQKILSMMKDETKVGTDSVA